MQIYLKILACALCSIYKGQSIVNFIVSYQNEALSDSQEKMYLKMLSAEVVCCK